MKIRTTNTHHVADAQDGRLLKIGAEGYPGVPRAGGRRCLALEAIAAEAKEAGVGACGG